MNLRPTPEARAQRREERHAHRRRAALTQVYLPIAAGLVVLAGLAVVIFLLPGQVADNVIIEFLLLCPLSIALFIVYALGVLVVTGFAKGHQLSGLGLDKLNDLAFQVRHAVVKASSSVNEASIKFNTAATPVTHVIKSTYDPDADAGDTGHLKTDGRNEPTFR
jgi:hypothetical protein